MAYTPNDPTPNINLDRRVANGNPLNAEAYDYNMETIDTEFGEILAALAEKLGKSGGEVGGTVQHLFDGLFSVFGSASDKFSIQRYNNEFHLTYNARRTEVAWQAYDMALPAFRMTFTRSGTLVFYTAPAGPSITWTKKAEFTKDNLIAVAPFLAQTTSQFNGEATFKSKTVFEEVVEFKKLMTLLAGFKLTGALTLDFEGLWATFGSATDKFSVQRAENSVYFTYNMYHNGTSWVVRDVTKTSVAIQYTNSGSIRIRIANPGVTAWTTLLDVGGERISTARYLAVEAANSSAGFGSSTDKITINRASDGHHSICYNAFFDGSNYKSHDSTKPSLSIQFRTDGKLAIHTGTATSGNITWIEAFAIDPNKISLSRAVELAAVLTSTVTTGSAPFVVNSQTLVQNLNADMVDGLHAQDLVNYSYESGWFGVSRNNTYTVDHNLNTYPRQVIILYRTSGASNAHSVIYPSTGGNGPDGADVPYAWFPNQNQVSIRTPALGSGNFVGTNWAGSRQTSGEYKVIVIR